MGSRPDWDDQFPPARLGRRRGRAMDDPTLQSTAHRKTMARTERQRELGQQLRADAVRVSARATSGHPTSSMSAADLAAVLLDGHLKYDFDNPRDPRNDRLVFSKG